MKALQYAVTSQYGGGFHVFLGYRDGLDEALNFATQSRDRLQRVYEEAKKTRSRAGVKPRVMVWKLAGEFAFKEAPLNGAEFMASPQSQEVKADTGGGETLELVRLPLGALEGNV